MLLLYAIVQTRSSGWQKPMSVRDPGAFIVRWAALAATVRRCGSITLLVQHGGSSGHALRALMLKCRCGWLTCPHFCAYIFRQ